MLNKVLANSIETINPLVLAICSTKLVMTNKFQ